MIYLDPHYCRPTLSSSNSCKRLEQFQEIDDIQVIPLGNGDGAIQTGLEATSSFDSTNSDPEALDDSTYHCNMLLSMLYDQVDPSLALAFFCDTADAFKKLSDDLKKVRNARLKGKEDILEGVPGLVPAPLRTTRQAPPLLAPLRALHRGQDEDRDER